jgi:hypothetical protein
MAKLWPRFFAHWVENQARFHVIIAIFAAQRRAISSGVEHCIHTAGVASSKLASPTKIPQLNQALREI